MSNAAKTENVECTIQTRSAIELSKSVFVEAMPRARTIQIVATQAVMLTDIVTWAHANVLEVELTGAKRVKKFAWTHPQVLVNTLKSVLR